jgi:hypothetical protein
MSVTLRHIGAFGPGSDARSPISPKMFLFTRTIDGVRYGGEVSCRDWNDAREWCRQAGVTLDGEHVATFTGIGAGLYVRAVTRLRNWWKRP